MLPVHKAEVFNLTSDDDLLSFMFSHPMEELNENFEELTPQDSNVANIPHIPSTIPIQTGLESLRSEAEALNITAENLKEIKMKELQAIYVAEPRVAEAEKKAQNCAGSDDNQPQGILLPKFQQSNQIFTQIITKYPNYPSAYNNRAQLNQLLALYVSQYPELFTQLTQTPVSNDEGEKKAQISKKIKLLQLQALSDLNQSIQLCHRLYPLFAPDGTTKLLQLQETEEIEIKKEQIEFEHNNPGKEFTRPKSKLVIPRVLIQSLCQRAILHKLRGNELLSFQDFKQAAALGSTMAKEEIDSMNTFERLNRETVFQMMKQHTSDLNDVASGYQEQIRKGE
jgi:hypothetical protein